MAPSRLDGAPDDVIEQAVDDAPEHVVDIADPFDDQPALPNLGQQKGLDRLSVSRCLVHAGDADGSRGIGPECRQGGYDYPTMETPPMPMLPLPPDLPDTIASRTEQRWQDLVTTEPFFAELGPGDQSRLLRLWSLSDFAANWCCRHPAAFIDLWRSGRLDQRHDSAAFAALLDAEFAEVADEPTLLRLLRQIRNREMVRIAWRDLLGLATLEETMLACSDLADELVDRALTWLYDDHCRQAGTPRSDSGEPQRLIVLGMGKLGGRELNFSSDIDLIFAYPEPGATDGRRALDNGQFFTRLGQRLINALHSQTADGFVFRVDMRLRPFGASGALVTHFGAMEEYYQRHGREWERYALLKARVIAGDREAGAVLLKRLEGFIYRRYLDYGSLASMREMKRLISIEAARKGQGDNLKTGPGGIREVEFITQVFQLTYGGRDRHLRSPHLLPTLKYLGERGLLPAETSEALLSGYRFLRNAENHLQMVADQQVHSLPEADDERQRIALGMGFDDWAHFHAALQQHRQRVQRHFEAVFGNGDQSEAAPLQQSMETLWLALDGHETVDGAGYLQAAGYEQPEATLKALRDFHDDRRIQALSADGRKRLDRVMPALLGAVAAVENPDDTLGRLLALLAEIGRRTVYLSLLAEQPQVLEQLAQLASASPWVGDYLARHPILLDELITPETLRRPPDRDGLRRMLEAQFERIDIDDDEQVMDQLRHFKHAQVFRVAAADIVGALPVMKVSDHLSWIAEVTLEKVLQLAWRKTAGRHGEPAYLLDGERRRAQFIIVGYGKLGGYEMGYHSDLDIVFIHDSQGRNQYTNGARSIDNATFFARLATRIISLLTTLTAAGELYEVDTRLRPSGRSGLLVSSLEAFRKYQQGEAWTWEHQALVRARPVAGDGQLADAFRRLRAEILSQPRDRDALRAEVRKMRETMWREHKVLEADFFDLKKSPGGITDIEFIVQYLVLAHAHEHPALTRWTDNIRILVTLADSGVIEPELSQQLIDAYRAMRDKIHRLNLQGKSPRLPADAFSAERALVRRCWREFLESAQSPGAPGDHHPMP